MRNIRTFAAIDVGSYELAMKVFEFNGKGNMRQIDCLKHKILERIRMRRGRSAMNG